MRENGLKKHILLIDDSEDMHDLMRTLLEADGHKIECTSNGVEALSLLRGGKELPDLIFLDSLMPEMNGVEFRKQQCMDDRLKHIPVIILSGEQDEELWERMLHPQQIFIKPFQIELIMSSLL